MRTCGVPGATLCLALAAVMFASALLPFPAAADGQVPATVDEVVNVRAGRGQDTRRVARLAPGETVSAADCRDGWCAVSRPGAGDLLGYVSAPLLKPKSGTLPVANPVPGTQFTVTPDLLVRETYDNNIMFQDVSDMESRLTPSLAVSLRSETSDLTARAMVDVLRYSQYSEFDRINQEYRLGLNHSLSDLARLELHGRTRSDYTFESALEQSGVIAVKSPRREYSLEPGMTYRVTERDELHLGSEATEVRHQEKPANDLLAKRGTLDYSRMLDASRSRLLSRAGYTTTSYDTGDQTMAVLGAGYEWFLSETLSWTALAGPSLSRDHFAGRIGESDASHTGLAGESRLRYRQERLAVEFGGDLGAVPGAGGEDTLRRRLLGGAVWQLSEQLNLGLSGAWYRATTRGYVRDQDNTVVSLTPNLEYALSEHSSLRLAFDYTCIDDHLAEEYRQGQRITLSLHLEFPRELQ